MAPHNSLFLANNHNVTDTVEMTSDTVEMTMDGHPSISIGPEKVCVCVCVCERQHLLILTESISPWCYSFGLTK